MTTTVRAACLALALLLAPAPALARSIEIRGFEADIIVRRDGSVQVTERITVHFEGSWNGLLREIPVAYDWNGFNYNLQLELNGATDERGNQLEVEKDRESGNRVFRIYVPGAQDATHTVILTYTVANGLRFFEDHDELYWNVTGNDWDVPVGHASAVVTLPPEVTNIRATVFTGVHGTTQANAEVAQVANSLNVNTTTPLGYREGLTVVLGWDPGVVHRPTQTERVASFALANGILLVPILAFFLMHNWWRKHGRDPEQLSITPQYEPPEALTPGELGMLMDNRADMRDVIATLVDLAVRGWIRIDESEDAALFGLIRNNEYTFNLLRPLAEWGPLKAHETALLSALFDNGSSTSVELSELKNSFYEDLPTIKDHLAASLISSGFCTRRPDKVIIQYFLLAAAAGAIVGVGGAAFLGTRGENPAPGIIAGMLTFVVMLGFAFVMPARTIRGARIREQALGFEEFLRRVEKDRFERVIRTPEMFEKYLPYAMAFGVEEKWARAFDDIYREPPDWYRGRYGNQFLARAFVADLSSMATQTGTAMAASPRGNAGSSGFGGGGFSGGGFGGGGGGGF